MLQVFVFRDGEFLGTDVFAQKRVVIGRKGGDADLLLDSPEVSRNHAFIEVDGRIVHITDAGSTNGVLVNESPITRAKVGPLDEIVVGPFELKLKLVSKRRTAQPQDDATVLSAQHTVVTTAPLLRRDTEDLPGTDSAPASNSAAPQAQPSKSGDSTAQAQQEAREASLASPQERPSAADKRRPVTRSKSKAANSAKSAASAEKERRTAPLEASDGKKKVGASTRVDIPPEHGRPPLWRRVRDTFNFGKGLPLAKSKRREPLGRPDTPEAAPKTVPEVTAKAAPKGGSRRSRQPAVQSKPTYSLHERVARDDKAVLNGDGRLAFEVFAFRGEHLVEARLLSRGDSFHAGPALGLLQRLRAPDLPRRLRLFKLTRKGTCAFQFPGRAHGLVRRAGKATALGELSAVARVHRRGQSFSLPLSAGDIVEMSDGPLFYRGRFVRAPRIPRRVRRPWRERLDGVITRALGSSALFHLLVLVLIAVLAPDSAALQAPAPPQDAFVEVNLDTKLTLEEPPKPPEPEPPAEAPAPKPPTPSRAPNPRPRPRAGGTSKKPKGVLGLLAKSGAASTAGPAAAAAAATNVSVAKVPGPSSGFRVSGLQSKVASSDVSLGGGGGLETRGAAALRGGGGGGGALSGSAGRRQVGALVQKVPRMMHSTGGSLDRSEIQRVINENIGQIQRCYERELVRQPGLSGKIQVEWVIGSSGAVRTARQQFSNLSSTNVSNCIMNAIRTWRFPTPKGGDVVVSYPFIFRSTGF